MKLAGRWVYLYRAIDQFGQVIDVLVSEKRDLRATRRFFTRALEHGPRPAEVSTDRAPAYPRVLEELLPPACHIMERYANNPVEADHGRLKSRLRPMRGLKRLQSAQVISAGHAFVQNLRPGHYELGTEAPTTLRAVAAFTELTPRHLTDHPPWLECACTRLTQQCPTRCSFQVTTQATKLTVLLTDTRTGSRPTQLRLRRSLGSPFLARAANRRANRSHRYYGMGTGPELKNAGIVDYGC